MVAAAVSLAAAAIVAATVGCGNSGPVEVLEIGDRAASDEFVPFEDDDFIRVVRGPNELNMVVPSVRAVGIDPTAPDPTIEVTVEGYVMAEDIEDARIDMISNGDGYVLWELRVPFMAEMCCFMCSPATITASITDASGKRFEGQRTLILQRDTCPDPDICCATVGACLDPSLTQVCQ